MAKTNFKDCALQAIDFAECDLTGSVFDNCDLFQANFDRSILKKADFRDAFNYCIDPEKNQIKKAKFSLAGIVGLLEKYDIIIDK